MDLVLARVLRQVGDPAEQERPALAGQAIDAPVIEKSFHVAVPGLLGQSRRQLAADFVRADDHLATPGAAMLAAASLRTSVLRHAQP